MLSEMRTPTLINVCVVVGSHMLFMAGTLVVQAVPLDIAQEQVDYLSVTRVLGDPIVWLSSLWAVAACVAPVEMARLFFEVLRDTEKTVDGVNSTLEGFERAAAAGMLGALDQALMLDGCSEMVKEETLEETLDSQARKSFFPAIFAERLALLVGGKEATGVEGDPDERRPPTEADTAVNFEPACAGNVDENWVNPAESGVELASRL